MDDMVEVIARSLGGFATPQEEERLRVWRAASLGNERRYRDVAALWSATSPLSVPGAPAPAAADLMHPRRAGGRWRRAIAIGAVTTLAASFALALGLREWRAGPPPDWSLGADRFVTQADETATLSLDDGTVVRLAPGTQLRLLKSTSAREVWLEGRAYFAVAEMSGVPFRIRSARGETTVLGTEFDLDDRGRELRMFVIKGRVALEASGERVEVAAGQMSRVFEDGRVAVLDVENARASLDWVGDLLVFQAAPMRQVAAEIGAHYGRTVVIADTVVANRVVTAWFSGRPFDDVIAVVCRVVEAHCSIDARGATIGARGATGGARRPAP
jgi:ferric-dicitrate binding protein FerR (iron transport regulator)